ncbi:MAG TPA: methyltransferase [Hanamia sp.]|nr:methyltransferase [Hanamia sp.]
MNDYFQFRQFKINQDKSSMKVCTDSCLFGAWIADKIERKDIQPKRILDIGSGTGLLSLIIAQKSNADIDAVEIEENSYGQTKANFAESPWQQRIQAFHTDIKNWHSSQKYDLIISNPPFFENDLKSGNKNKNIAKHHDTLTLAELLQSIKNNLSKEGNFAVLLPFHRTGYFKNLAAENGFHLPEELLVKQTPRHSCFRSILFFGTQEETIISNELIIKENGNYTTEFNHLLKDYYLNS